MVTIHPFLSSGSNPVFAGLSLACLCSEDTEGLLNLSRMSGSYKGLEEMTHCKVPFVRSTRTLPGGWADSGFSEFDSGRQIW